MKKNINDYERLGRVIGGSFLASLAFWGPKKPWYLLSLIPVAEGIVGKCLFYSALNVSTRKHKDDQANAYFPVQSSSERAAGHPLVGVS